MEALTHENYLTRKKECNEEIPIQVSHAAWLPRARQRFHFCFKLISLTKSSTNKRRFQTQRRQVIKRGTTIWTSLRISLANYYPLKVSLHNDKARSDQKTFKHAITTFKKFKPDQEIA